MRTLALDTRSVIRVPQTVPFMCEGYVCRVMLNGEPVGPRLNHFPRVGAAPDLEVALGEHFHIQGGPRVYHVVRQSGEATPLMVDRVQ